MAGIFEPVDLPDPAAPKAGIINTGGAGYDYSGAISTLGQIGSRVKGKLAVEDAAEEVSATQENFLGDLADNRRDMAEIDALKQAHPTEGAAYDAASKRIKTLQQGISTRQINPSQALTRIESAKREAAMKAPMFINEIRGLTGAKGASFDHEASLIMKRTEIRNTEMAKYDLNPEIPSNVRTYQEIIAAETTNQYQANTAAITSREAGAKLGTKVTSVIQLATEQFNNMVSSNGGMQSLPSDLRMSEISRLTSLTEGGAKAVVEQFLQANFTPKEAAMVDDTTRDRYAAMMTANAVTRIKQLDGSIPSTVSTNERKFHENKVMNNIAVKNPALYSYIVVQSSVPSGTLGGKTVQAAAGLEWSEYTANMGLGINLDAVTKTGLEAASDGTISPKEIQDAAASGMTSFREYLKTAQNPDPDVAKAHFSTINTQARFIAQAPKEFTPKVFDELIASVNDNNFMQVFSKLDPSTQEEFRENMRTAAQVYARENMAVDMAKQLDKQTWVDFAAEGRQSGGYATVRELVTPIVSGSGVITFIPVEGLTSQNDLMRASTQAQRLNKMYSSKTLGVVNAAQKLGGLSDDLRREYTIRNFQGAMGSVAKEPLREGAQEAREPTLGVVETWKYVRQLASKEEATEEDVMQRILSRELEVSPAILASVTHWRKEI